MIISKSFRKLNDGFFLRGESFYNVASEIDKLEEELGMKLTAYSGLSLHEQSHRQSYLSLFMNRFCGSGIYIMDEPESALSATNCNVIKT